MRMVVLALLSALAMVLLASCDQQTDPRTTPLPVLETYPKFTVNSASPSGPLTHVGPNTLVAIFDITAVGDKNIIFGPGGRITMNVSQHLADADRLGNDWAVKNSRGDTLDMTSRVSDSNVATASFYFETPFFLFAGTTTQLYVYADTSDFEDDGDAIQVWLDDNLLENQLVWYVAGDDRPHEYPEIIFRGDIYANALVNSG